MVCLNGKKETNKYGPSPKFTEYATNYEGKTIIQLIKLKLINWLFTSGLSKRPLFKKKCHIYLTSAYLFDYDKST